MNGKKKENINLDKQMVMEKTPKVLNIPFDDFWKLYDYKKGSKVKVSKAWGRLSNKERVAVMQYLPYYKESTPDKQFRKHPLTFLNNETWNDEIIAKPAVNRYGELLKHPDWQRKRFEIMQRDDFSCQLCGDIQTELHVHHKRYINGLKPWEYDDKELITLCITCHKKIS